MKPCENTSPGLETRNQLGLCRHLSQSKLQSRGRHVVSLTVSAASYTIVHLTPRERAICHRLLK